MILANLFDRRYYMRFRNHEATGTILAKKLDKYRQSKYNVYALFSDIMCRDFIISNYKE